MRNLPSHLQLRALRVRRFVRPKSSSSSNAAAETEPRLRVCVLAACPFPANHGTPGSIRELVEATAERGHEVHVVTYHIGENLPLAGVQLHRIPDWTGERGVIVGPTRYRPLYDFQMIFTAIRTILRHKLDLIHAHGYEAALVAACCRPVVRRPVLYSAHNQMGDELASYNFFRSKRLANGLAWLLDRTVPRLGDRCIPHSVNLQEFLLARGLAGRSEPVLNFGIDVDQRPTCDRERLRNQLGVGDDPIVFYSGVIDQFQRLDLLLRAMAYVLRRIPRAKLLLLSTIRNEKHEEAIRREASRLGIAKSLILRVPSDMEKGQRLLSICDVAVVPRPGAPGFPIKLLNYMAAQRPCVMFASSASGLSHGEHVWLVGEDTGPALGKGIVRLLNDAPLRERLAAGGNRFVRARHDRRAVAAQLCQAYVRLLKETRRWPEIAGRPRVHEPSPEVLPTDAVAFNSNRYLEGAVHASA
ncbi:MAG TPA: glycosyltransferase family 4 protein [Lacipirellulaceae bacterium]|nr:glycosyltransferase family 4 protein [Lacipirellulaceae bacterium]